MPGTTMETIWKPEIGTHDLYFTLWRSTGLSLKCVAYTLKHHPNYSSLLVTAYPRSMKLLPEWARDLSQLGQHDDVTFGVRYNQTYRMYRPVCVEHSKTDMLLHFLSKPALSEYSAAIER
jgi:hypothetical protein